MTNEIQTVSVSNQIETVLMQGDLSKLDANQRVQYYNSVCKSLGLNPLTRPFDYITLNSKLTLYARRDCTDQLRKLHGVSITITSREQVGDVYVVTANARMVDGRTDESTGAVSVKGLGGDTLANALMKAETKAKRRVTLSIVGLGWLDETEIETIPDARPVVVVEQTEKPVTHEMIARYDALTEKADVLGLPYPKYQDTWNYDTLAENGKALKQAITQAESEIK
jgi:hypothetical protein